VLGGGSPAPGAPPQPTPHHPTPPPTPPPPPSSFLLTLCDLFYTVRSCVCTGVGDGYPFVSYGERKASPAHFFF